MIRKYAILTLILSLITTTQNYGNGIFSRFLNKVFESKTGLIEKFFSNLFSLNILVISSKSNTQEEKVDYENKILVTLHHENVLYYGYDKQSCNEIESMMIKFSGKFFKGYAKRDRDFIRDDMGDHMDKIFGKLEADALIFGEKKQIYEKINPIVKNWGKYSLPEHAKVMAELLSQASQEDQEYFQKLFEEYEHRSLYDAVKSCKQRQILK